MPYFLTFLTSVGFRRRLFLMIVSGLSLTCVWAGQDRSSSAVVDDGPPVDTSFVRLDGDVLFQVRGMIGYSAEKRAQAIEERLRKVAADRNILVDSVSLVELPDRSNLVMGGNVIVSLLDSDADIERIPRSVLAERVRSNVVHAINEYRHARTADVLLRHSFWALFATVILLLLLLALSRIFKALVNKAEVHIKSRMEALEQRSSKVIESRPLWTVIVGILNIIRAVLVLLICYFYLNLVLGLYPWTRHIAIHLFSLFVQPVQVLGKAFVAALPDLVFLAVLALIVRYALKVIHLFFMAVQQGSLSFPDFDPDWALPTYRIVRVLVIAFAVVVAYPYIPGANSDAFKGVSLFVGVLFSLGSSSFIANMIAGIAITYRRAFKVGDIIKINEVVGLATEVRLQATHLRTLHNEVIVIPNSTIMNSHVVNYSSLSKSQGLILHTAVGIGYEVPWRQVEAMLLIAAERTDGVRKDKKAFVRQKALGDFSVVYELNVYCDAPTAMPVVYTELHKNILDVFNEYGVQIMTPAYEGDPDAPKVVSKDQWFTAPAKRPGS